MQTELRKDNEWGVIDGEPCRVIEFAPIASVKNGKVIVPNKTEPYASVVLECKKLPSNAKGARYTLGARIENKFLDLLELSYIAYFTGKEKKAEKITECILVTDTLKFLISITWEGKLISNKQCEDVAVKLEEIGKMLGGWKKSLSNPEKKNRTP